MSHDKKSAKRSQTLSLSKGFTLVELLVIAPVVILVIGGFIGAIIAMTGNVLATRSANMLTYNIQDALDRIESDVRISGGFLNTNFAIDTAQKFNGNNFQATRDTIGDTLVLNTYATKGNPSSGNREIIYRSDNRPLMFNVVYFVDSAENNTLYRRTLAQSDYKTAGPSVPWQQPSCKIASGGFCVTKDIKLIDGVKKFSVRYYSPSGIGGNYTEEITDINKISLTPETQIKVTIEAEGSTAGRKFSGSGTISAISPNNYFAP